MISLLLALPSAILATPYTFQAENSNLEVFVPRAGFLSMLGHDHTISASHFEGSLNFEDENPDKTKLSLRVPVASLAVIDEGVDAETRAKIEKEMRSRKVLDEENHSEIQFRSREIIVRESGDWLVTGALTVGGVSKSLTFAAEVMFPEADTVEAKGSVELKPEDFGIEPVKALGGAIKTASTIEIRFHVIGIREEVVVP